MLKVTEEPVTVISVSAVTSRLNKQSQRNLVGDKLVIWMMQEVALDDTMNEWFIEWQHVSFFADRKLRPERHLLQKQGSKVGSILVSS